MNSDIATARVIVADDRSCVELEIPADYPSTLFTTACLTMTLREHGVEMTPEANESLASFVAQGVPSGSPRRAVISRATPAMHGRDGEVQWLVDDDKRCDTGAAVDYYNQSAYVMVEAGQVIGRIVEPTPGEDGRDVLGGTIHARAGKPVELEIDESIVRDHEGQLVAQAQGVLVREPGAARISQMLAIDGYVDFSSGNIDFDGSVAISKGVRDCFSVRATGNIEVRGLIESAAIECGGDLIAHGGMAGRDRGSVDVNGNVHAKYLDSVKGEVRGNLSVEREVVNCDLLVHGNIEAPHGSIVGGKVSVTGAVAVETLGSDGGGTALVLGFVPQLEPIAKRFERILEALEKRKAKMVDEQNQLNCGEVTATNKERQTELMFEIGQLDASIRRAMNGLRGVMKEIQRRRTICVNVSKELHEGVTLDVRGQRWRIDSALRGPLEISLDEDGRLTCMQNQSTRPINQVATLMT